KEEEQVNTDPVVTDFSEENRFSDENPLGLTRELTDEERESRNELEVAKQERRDLIRANPNGFTNRQLRLSDRQMDRAWHNTRLHEGKSSPMGDRVIDEGSGKDRMLFRRDDQIDLYNKAGSRIKTSSAGTAGSFGTLVYKKPNTHVGREVVAPIAAAVITYFSAGLGSSLAGSILGSGASAAATTATTAISTAAISGVGNAAITSISGGNSEEVLQSGLRSGASAAVGQFTGGLNGGEGLSITTDMGVHTALNMAFGDDFETAIGRAGVDALAQGIAESISPDVALGNIARPATAFGLSYAGRTGLLDQDPTEALIGAALAAGGVSKEQKNFLDALNPMDDFRALANTVRDGYVAVTDPGRAGMEELIRMETPGARVTPDGDIVVPGKADTPAKQADTSAEKIVSESVNSATQDAGKAQTKLAKDQGVADTARPGLLTEAQFSTMVEANPTGAREALNEYINSRFQGERASVSNDLLKTSASDAVNSGDYSIFTDDIIKAIQGQGDEPLLTGSDYVTLLGILTSAGAPFVTAEIGERKAEKEEKKAEKLAQEAELQASLAKKSGGGGGGGGISIGSFFA
ncbi:MAG: hypothetical protein ACYTGH_08990, partial [Planctomycetota bacterium]